MVVPAVLIDAIHLDREAKTDRSSPAPWGAYVGEGSLVY